LKSGVVLFVLQKFSSRIFTEMPIDFKRIKSLFVVEEEKPGQQHAAKAESTAQESTPTGEITPDEPSSGEPGEASEKFMQVLFGAMEKANLPGMDYLEYKQSLKSLEKMPMEDSVRFQSAFAMAQTMGATPQKLVDSANHYLEVLKGEQSKFEQALIKQTKDRIGNRQETLNNLEGIIQQKTEQIKKLTAEIDQHRQEMEQIRQELKAASAKVETTKNDFIASYNVLVSQILADVESMKKYLK
jgi:hypothetical protein